MRKALASLATDHLLEQRWVACAHGCRQLAASGLELYGGATSLIGRRAAPPVSRIIWRMDWRQREDGDRTRDN